MLSIQQLSWSLLLSRSTKAEHEPATVPGSNDIEEGYRSTNDRSFTLGRADDGQMYVTGYDKSSDHSHSFSQDDGIVQIIKWTKMAGHAEVRTHCTFSCSRIDTGLSK